MSRNRNSTLLPNLRLALFLGLAAVCGGAAGQAQKQAAGRYVIELSVSPKPRVTETTILFAITDESGKPVDTAHASGRADFSSGGLKGRATLRPEAPNRMKGYGLMSAKPDLRIGVAITLQDGSPITAEFAPGTIRN